MKKQIVWESFEDAKKRIEAQQGKKKVSKKTEKKSPAKRGK